MPPLECSRATPKFPGQAADAGFGVQLKHNSRQEKTPEGPLCFQQLSPPKLKGPETSRNYAGAGKVLVCLAWLSDASGFGTAAVCGVRPTIPSSLSFWPVLPLLWKVSLMLETVHGAQGFTPCIQSPKPESLVLDP